MYNIYGNKFVSANFSLFLMIIIHEAMSAFNPRLMICVKILSGLTFSSNFPCMNLSPLSIGKIYCMCVFSTLLQYFHCSSIIRNGVINCLTYLKLRNVYLENDCTHTVLLNNFKRRLCVDYVI